MFLTATSTSITHTSNSDFSGTASGTAVSGGDVGLEYLGGSANTSKYSFPSSSTPIFRSAGYMSTNELASGTAGFLITINSAGTTTFSGGTIPNNVGIGDAVIYDDDGDDDLDVDDAILFIHGRTDNQTYTLRTEAGSSTIASTTSSNDTWAIYRAYTSLRKCLDETDGLDENDTLNDNVEDFDTSRDIAANNTIMNVACYGDGADTAEVQIAGWTTGSSNYVRGLHAGERRRRDDHTQPGVTHALLGVCAHRASASSHSSRRRPSSLDRDQGANPRQCA